MRSPASKKLSQALMDMAVCVTTKRFTPRCLCGFEESRERANMQCMKEWPRLPQLCCLQLIVPSNVYDAGQHRNFSETGEHTAETTLQTSGA